MVLVKKISAPGWCFVDVRSVLSFLFAFLWIEDPSRRIFGQKLFLNQSKNSDDNLANSIFPCLGARPETAGSGPVWSSCRRGLGFLLLGIWGMCKVASWAFRGRGYGTSWAWEAALLAYFVFVGSGWCFGTRDGNGVFGCRGQGGKWVVHGTFLMNVDLVPQMKKGLHARLAEGVLGRELDLGGE